MQIVAQRGTDGGRAGKVEMVTVLLPIKTTNPLNGTHGHWAGKAKARKAKPAEVAEAAPEMLPQAEPQGEAAT